MLISTADGVLVGWGMKRVGIIGFGAVGSWLAERLASGAAPQFTLSAVCARERQLEQAAATCPASVKVCTAMAEFLDVGLDVVIEAAGQPLIVDWGREILSRGCELQILSAGALADRALREDLCRAALESGGRMTIPAGALAGFRGLMTLRQAGLTYVRYTSVKPPRAWAETPAAQAVDLDGLRTAKVIYVGNAADAAQRFPANANLAAAVALAGVGFEETRITLVADPATELNTGRVEARSPIASMDLTLSGEAFEQNPKTSQITGMSVIAALCNSSDCISFV